MLQYIHPFTQRGLAMLNGCSVAALVRLYYSFILSLKRLWVDGYVFRGIRVCACKIISVFLQAFFFVTWRTTEYTEYTELLTDCRLNHNHKLQSIFPVAPCSPFPLSTSVYVCCFCAFTCKLSYSVLFFKMTVLTTTKDASISLFGLTNGTQSSRMWRRSSLLIQTAEANGTHHKSHSPAWETARTQKEQADLFTTSDWSIQIPTGGKMIQMAGFQDGAARLMTWNLGNPSDLQGLGCNSSFSRLTPSWIWWLLAVEYQIHCNWKPWWPSDLL